MKGLFECLRNKVYKEEEDILAQMAANAAMDDSEIEAFEGDDEDEDDELDMFDGIDIDAIDDADIEKATNEFNMDEGDRAACRLKTIDLKEDAVELQPETKLNRRVANDPDMRNFVGAGDGSGRDMDNKGDGVKLQPETALNRKVSQDPDMREFVGAGDGSGKDMKTEAFDAMMEEVMDEIEAMDEGVMDKIKATRNAKRAYKDIKSKAADARNDELYPIQSEYAKKCKAHERAGEDLTAEYDEKEQNVWNKYHDTRKAAKKDYKAKKRAIWSGRQAKAKEVAVEEGCTLDEAMLFVLECEQEFINEGYELEEIYDEACKRGMIKGAAAAKQHAANVAANAADTDLHKGLLKQKLYNSEVIARNAAKPAKKGMGLGKKAAIGAGVAAAAGGAALALKKHRQAKAKEVAVEEGCTLDEAMLFVLECERDFLNEGYTFEDIYMEDAVELQPETKLNKKVSQDDDMRDFVGAGDGSGKDMNNENALDDAIAKLAKQRNNNGVFPDKVELQDDALKEGECGDPDECAPKRQQQKPVGDVDNVSVDGVDTDDELMLGIEAVIQEIEESLDNDFDI